MPDTPDDTGVPRHALGHAAAGGGIGALVTFAAQTFSAAGPAGTPGFPTAALVSIVVGCLLAGALLGAGARHRRSRWATVGFGLACGLTSLGGYTALGLTVTDGPASLVFLTLTPLAALAAGTVGYAVARTVSRRRAAERVAA